MSRPVDYAERQRGLDAQTSFIVQAPAGSGKTELLSQRFLRLLTTVQEPESVVAITFTRKAAAEMRQRIVKALLAARLEPAPAEAHARQTWQLAGEVLTHASARDWDLLDNPRRLQVVTIDSLSGRIARLQPVNAGIGSLAEPVADAMPLYRSAALEIVAQLESDGDCAEALRIVLDHLGNDLRRLVRLLESMLAQRDQWMRHVFNPTHGREMLEAGLARIVAGALAGLAGRFSPPQREKIEALADYARGNLAALGKPLDGVPCAFPAAEPSALKEWLALADFLLTASGGWRKGVNKNNGFPTDGDNLDKETAKAWKADFKSLLDSLAAEPELESLLAGVRDLPAPAYTDRQWAVLEALRQILKVGVVTLDVVFRERGQVDYSAVALAALHTLRESAHGDDVPTDVALALDYRIEHLLVDEFQDTSVSQWNLLERLTESWIPGDGRTLFAVGDPMQSIYRFRQAEVGLFLRAQTEGIGSLPLEPLTLRANFRSQAGVVEWVNRTFPGVLGERMDIAEGAVAYTASDAVRDPLPGEAVSLHTLPAGDDALEAQRVLDILADEPPGEGNRVAILVRGRAHLATIAVALREAGHRFQAVEIDSLAQRPAVRDLLTLTRALLQPADRTAWLSVFRAPWCGLSLIDLHRLSHWRQRRVLSELLLDTDFADSLDEHSRRRWLRCKAALVQALETRGRVGLRQWLSRCWLALGGPACLGSATELEDVDTVLNLLDEFDAGGVIEDWPAFEAGIERLFAEADVAAPGWLQLMTIHKAKGLEFETVILPGLNRRARGDDQKLLAWLETASERHGGPSTGFLLAPIKAENEQSDAIYRYVQLLDRRKGEHELARLLYVAATRAIRRLHLLAGFREKNDGEWSVASGSLLSTLWAVTQAGWQATPFADLSEDEEPLMAVAAPIRCLDGHWQHPLMPGPGSPGATDDTESGEEIEFSWAGETARHVGTVVHAILEELAGREALPRQMHAESLRQTAERQLRRQGVPEELMAKALRKSVDAVDRTLADDKGRWILDSRHEAAASELPLTAVVDGELVNTVIDRTFIEDGERWIIDYKTGSHEGGGLEHFLDEEQQRYRHQLERYARIMHMREGLPVRVALYFPVMGGWREWRPELD